MVGKKGKGRQIHRWVRCFGSTAVGEGRIRARWCRIDGGEEGEGAPDPPMVDVLWLGGSGGRPNPRSVCSVVLDPCSVVGKNGKGVRSLVVEVPWLGGGGGMLDPCLVVTDPCTVLTTEEKA